LGARVEGAVARQLERSKLTGQTAKNLRDAAAAFAKRPDANKLVNTVEHAMDPRVVRLQTLVAGHKDLQDRFKHHLPKFGSAHMSIFSKLAYDHIIDVKGDSPMILGPNDLRPSDPSPPPVSMKADVQGPLTDLTVEGHKQTMHGELSRAFDNYLPSVEDWGNTIGQLMSARINEISGSSAASQALTRHRNRT
jgi:hypothetical protein